MQCGRCDKHPATCKYRDEPREQDATVLQETRDSDPHYKEFEEALQNPGGVAQGLTTPPGGSLSRAQRAAQRSARRVGSGSTALEEKMEVMATTLTALTELINQKAQAPVIRKVKGSPKTQASSSEESASEAESEEVSSDESVDPHKARPLPPTSIGSRQSSKGSKTSKKKSIRMMSFPAKKEVMRTYLSRHEDKLRTTPEDWALTSMDLAERPDLMYDQHTFEEADWERR